MKHLILATAMLATGFGVLSAQAGELTFGSESPSAGRGKASGPAADSVTYQEKKDAFAVEAPNFWSLAVQFEGVTMESPASDKSLAVEVKGRAPGTSPKLKVVFVSKDWARKSVYEFDLSSLSEDQFSIVESSQPVSGPLADGDTEVLDLSAEEPAHLQFFVTAESTKEPFKLEIRKIQSSK